MSNENKYRVTLVVAAGAETIKAQDNGISEPEEYIRTELGWASDSFDQFEIVTIEKYKDKKEDTDV